jgi:hypothetical protein
VESEALMLLDLLLIVGGSLLCYIILWSRERNIKVTNPYSGQSEMLTMYESILYGNIIKAEQNEDYETMQRLLDKFSRLNAKAYMVLLD